MRLLSLQLRHYRRHQQLSVSFDPGLTVIEGANESGKSTLAEAIHRALFLPARSSGAVQEAMRARPAQGEPELELGFEAEGHTYTLQKRFAGSRGSVSLRTSGGSLWQGDSAEEQLAQLVGARAVARARQEEQLRERWGHLWVWQGSAGNDPLLLSAEAIDQPRLLQRLQASGSLAMQSSLDRQVLDLVHSRWLGSYTEKGKLGRAGSGLAAALAAEAEARGQQAEAEAQLAAQQGARQEYDQLSAELEQLGQLLPLLEQWQSQQSALQALATELAPRQAALEQWQQQQQRLSALRLGLAPRLGEQQLCQRQLPQLELQRRQAAERLERALAEAEQWQQWIKRLSLAQQLQSLEALQRRLAELQPLLASLPPLTAAQVEKLRDIQRQQQAAAVAVASLSTGVELLQAQGPVQLDGQPLAVGESLLLSEPTLLQVGGAAGLQLRISPGGRTSVAKARAQLSQANQRLAAALQPLGLADVEAAARAERQRTELLAEQQRLLEQRGSQSLEELRQQWQLLPEVPAEQADLARLRQQLDSLVPQGRVLRQELNQADAALGQGRQQLASLASGLQADQTAQVQAETLINDLQARHGSFEALEADAAQLKARITAQGQQLQSLEALLQQGHNLAPAAAAELPSLPQLRQRREQLLQQQAASGARLHVDGEVDLQAVLEQRQAALESRQGELQRLEREARMLNLLKGLLEEEQNAMALQYTAPLSERLDGYLSCLANGPLRTNLHYDSQGGFSRLEWQRGEGVAWDFQSLSGGSRELLAAALRISMAEVLAEAYDGCLPILFDDAFTNVDPGRLAGLAAMLQRAVDRGLQLIFLSCDPASSAGLAAGQRLLLPPAPAWG